MSLFTLTSLNRSIIQTGTLFPQQEQTPDEDTVQQGGAFSGVVIPDPDADVDTPDDPDLAEFHSFSNQDRLGFEQVVNWLVANAFGGSATGFTTAIDAFVNEWAVEWRDENDILGLDTPTLSDLLNNEQFLNGAAWLPLTSKGGIPPTFTSEQPILDEDGEVTDIQPLIGVVDPLFGVTFHTVEQVATDPQLKDAFVNLLFRGSPALAREAIGANVDRALAVTGTAPIEEQDRTTQALLDDTDFAGLQNQILIGRTIGRQQTVDTLDHFTFDQLVELAQGPAPTGGGGGARRTIEFDRNQLVEQTTNMWGDWYLENAPQGDVADIVDSYMREARSFWVGKGGQLDFATFVRERLRGQAKYSTFFRNKAPDMSEEEHNAQFANPIRQLGLRTDLATEQARTAVTSGGSPIEQLRRVTRTREAQLSGGFSQKLAATVQGLGAGARG